MKIAIITLPLHTNYGGILQAYALQKVLQKMGHTVEILIPSSIFPHSQWIMPLIYLKRMVKKLLRNHKTLVFIERRKKEEKPILEKNTSKFLNKYLHLRYIKELKELKFDDYDAIVVGSDQIWRKTYFCGMWYTKIQNAFLDFTKKWQIKRVAYAASFGVDHLKEYTTNEILKCRKALNQFDAVSVREDTGVSICKDYFQIEAHHVLDPTLLLEKRDYLNLIESSNSSGKSTGGLFCYYLDATEFKTGVAKQISEKLRLNLFKVNIQVDNRNLKVTARIQPPVEAWLKGFRDAEFVVTDSFHACVFSIIFEKPFIVVSNNNRGTARITSLLKMFGLENRLIMSDSEVDFSNINIYNHQNSLRQIIEKKKKESIEFIQSYLK